MLEFLKLKPNTFGLEISNSSIKIAQVKKSGKKFKLSSWGETEIPEGIFNNGEVKDEEKLSLEIKKAILNVRGEKIKTKYVVTCLPDTNAFSQVIKVPKMKEEELTSAIYFEAENHIPLSIEDVYFDFEVVSSENKEKNIDVLIVALPKKNVDPYISSIIKSDLIPYSLEIEPYSIIRVILQDKNIKGSNLLVDFGKNYTLLTIFKNKEIKFSLTSQISSNYLTKLISNNLKINISDAEKLKIENSPKIIDHKKYVMVYLIKEIKKCIDYHNSYLGSKIERIIFSGGGSNLKGLTNIVSNNFDIPVLTVNPLINFKKKSHSLIKPEESLKLTTVLGLAIREL